MTEILFASPARMITVGMRDYSLLHRFPGVDIKSPWGAIDSGRGEAEQWKYELGVMNYELRERRQRSLQYFTSSQTAAHFFLQVNGRLQVMQIFCGRLAFLTCFITY
jgi:hypothetical protein